MKKVNLSSNHQRSVSSSFKVVEEILIGIERELIHPVDGVLIKTEMDISVTKKESALKKISAARKLIFDLSTKYNLPQKSSPVSRFINSRKSSAWVILSDTTSKNMVNFHLI